MSDTKNTGRIKKYGVCLNDKCDNYKQIVEIVHGDLECPLCKKKLSPCAPPKKKEGNTKLYGIIAAVVVLATIIGCVIVLSGGSTKEPKPMTDTLQVDSVKEEAKDMTDTVTIVQRDTITRVDTVKIEKTIEKKVTPVAQKKTTTTTTTSKSTGSSFGSLRLSYGKYTGATKNGYPHGQGKLTFTTSRQINRNDVKGRTANAGDYVIGEFFNGFVVYGKHYDASGNLIGSLNFGVGSEDSYESK